MLALDGAGGDAAALRLMTRERWRSHGPALTTRKARSSDDARGPWEAKYVVPAWATDRGPWRDAFALLRTRPPELSSFLDVKPS